MIDFSMADLCVDGPERALLKAYRERRRLWKELGEAQTTARMARSHADECRLRVDELARAYFDADVAFRKASEASR